MNWTRRLRILRFKRLVNAGLAKASANGHELYRDKRWDHHQPYSMECYRCAKCHLTMIVELPPRDIYGQLHGLAMYFHCTSKEGYL